jgi:hypothetical protein
LLIADVNGYSFHSALFCGYKCTHQSLGNRLPCLLILRLRKVLRTKIGKG